MGDDLPRYWGKNCTDSIGNGPVGRRFIAKVVITDPSLAG
jgi:hypothetical protein